MKLSIVAGIVLASIASVPAYAGMHSKSSTGMSHSQMSKTMTAAKKSGNGLSGAAHVGGLAAYAGSHHDSVASYIRGETDSIDINDSESLRAAYQARHAEEMHNAYLDGKLQAAILAAPQPDSEVEHFVAGMGISIEKAVDGMIAGVHMGRMTQAQAETRISQIAGTNVAAKSLMTTRLSAGLSHGTLSAAQRAGITSMMGQIQAKVNAGTMTAGEVQNLAETWGARKTAAGDVMSSMLGKLATAMDAHRVTTSAQGAALPQPIVSEQQPAYPNPTQHTFFGPTGAVVDTPVTAIDTTARDNEYSNYARNLAGDKYNSDLRAQTGTAQPQVIVTPTLHTPTPVTQLTPEQVGKVPSIDLVGMAEHKLATGEWSATDAGGFAEELEGKGHYSEARQIEHLAQMRDSGRVTGVTVPNQPKGVVMGVEQEGHVIANPTGLIGAEVQTQHADSQVVHPLAGTTRTAEQVVDGMIGAVNSGRMQKDAALATISRLSAQQGAKADAYEGFMEARLNAGVKIGAAPVAEVPNIKVSEEQGLANQAARMDAAIKDGTAKAADILASGQKNLEKGIATGNEAMIAEGKMMISVARTNGATTVVTHTPSQVNPNQQRIAQIEAELGLISQMDKSVQPQLATKAAELKAELTKLESTTGKVTPPAPASGDKLAQLQAEYDAAKAASIAENSKPKSEYNSVTADAAAARFFKAEDALNAYKATVDQSINNMVTRATTDMKSGVTTPAEVKANGEQMVVHGNSVQQKAGALLVRAANANGAGVLTKEQQAGANAYLASMKADMTAGKISATDMGKTADKFLSKGTTMGDVIGEALMGMALHPTYQSPTMNVPTPVKQLTPVQVGKVPHLVKPVVVTNNGDDMTKIYKCFNYNVKHCPK